MVITSRGTMENKEVMELADYRYPWKHSYFFKLSDGDTCKVFLTTQNRCPDERLNQELTRFLTNNPKYKTI